MSALRQAVSALNDRLVMASAIGDALDLAAPQDDPPPWVHVFRGQIEAIRQAAEAVELAVNASEAAS